MPLSKPIAYFLSATLARYCSVKFKSSVESVDIMGANDNLCDIWFFVSKWRIYHDTPLFSMIWCIFMGGTRQFMNRFDYQKSYRDFSGGSKMIKTWAISGHQTWLKIQAISIGRSPATSGFSSHNRIPKCTPNTGWCIHGQSGCDYPSPSLFSTTTPE